MSIQRNRMNSSWQDTLKEFILRNNQIILIGLIILFLFWSGILQISVTISVGSTQVL